MHGHEDGHVVLSVADNGCGMSADFLSDSSVPSVSEHEDEGSRYRSVPVRA